MHSIIVEIALNLYYVELLFHDAGLIVEAQILRQDGNLTVIHDPSDDQLQRLEEYFIRMDVPYRITSAVSDDETSFRRPRHSAP